MYVALRGARRQDRARYNVDERIRRRNHLSHLVFQIAI